MLHVVARHFQVSDYLNISSCKRGIHTDVLLSALQDWVNGCISPSCFGFVLDSSVFRVTMGPYDFSNNERHVHTIDGHNKCLYAKLNKRYRKNTINNVVQLAELVNISTRCNMSERYKTLGKWLVWVNGDAFSIFHHAWHWDVSPLLIHGM